MGKLLEEASSVEVILHKDLEEPVDLINQPALLVRISHMALQPQLDSEELAGMPVDSELVDRAQEEESSAVETQVQAEEASSATIRTIRLLREASLVNNLNLSSVDKQQHHKEQADLVN